MSKDRKGLLTDNKGFSLVEIMVVIAILMILVGMAALSYSVVSNANVSKAANSLNSAFATARATSMAKGIDAGTLTLKIIDGKLYSYIGSEADGHAATASQMEKISNNAMTVTLANSSDAVGGTLLGDGYEAKYQFLPSGAVKDITDSNACVAYLFMNKKRGSRMFFYPETGRHDVGIWNF